MLKMCLFGKIFLRILHFCRHGSKYPLFTELSPRFLQIMTLDDGSLAQWETALAGTDSVRLRMSDCACSSHCLLGSQLSFYVLIHRYENPCTEYRHTLTPVLLTECWIRYLPKHLLTPPLRIHEAEILSTATSLCSRKKELSFSLTGLSDQCLGKHLPGALFYYWIMWGQVFATISGVQVCLQFLSHNPSVNPNRNVSNPSFWII